MLKSVRIVHFLKFGNHLSSPFLHFLEFVNVSFFYTEPKENDNIPNVTLPNVGYPGNVDLKLSIHFFSIYMAML